MSKKEEELVEAPEEAEKAAEEGKGQTRKLESGAETAKRRPRRSETKVLPPDPEMGLEVAAPASHLGLSREEMNWAAVAHASILVTLLLGLVTGGVGAILGVIIPALIWYVYREKSEYVADQARQATIFQLAGFVALLALAIAGTLLVVVGWAVSAVLVIILIGLILMPVMLIVTLLWIVAIVALPIVQAVYGCYAALETYSGRPFRYRWIADLVDRYQAQA
jgi:uncharacterized Tic20 family protein